MKKLLRAQSAMLAALLLIPALAACGGSDPVNDVTTSGGDPSGADETTTAADDSIKPLESRNLGGKDINVLIRSEWSYEFMVDEENGDSVSDAIYRRNTAVEDKYKCNLNFIDFAGNWANHESFTNTIHNSVLAGDGAYDFIAGYQAVLTTNIQNGDLMNLYDVPNLQLDAPWWTQEGVEALTYNGKCFEVGGDIVVSVLEGINCMFYNKRLAEEQKLPDLYDLVRSGKWTHEKFAELTKDIYEDLDNSGSKTINDKYGLLMQQYYIRPYVVVYDTPTISKDGELVWYNEHTLDVIDKLIALFTTEDVFYTYATADAVSAAWANGNALFITTMLGTAAQLRSMDDDFGIIPMPKFNEDQEGYYTTTKNEVSMICVPKTAPDPDVSGFVIEAMCRESTDTVAKSFYETALKGKYVRDENSAEMIDLIRSGLTFDFGWVASMSTGVSGATYENQVKAGSNTFTSWFAGEESSIREKISAYLAAYE